MTIPKTAFTPAATRHLALRPRPDHPVFAKGPSTPRAASVTLGPATESGAHELSRPPGVLQGESA
ncbi:hypothetical protein [Deinococcus yavapaiensis]|uniref:Uncharacterized protein n=1 Tax=Deinococcus yavapaiensis KR-236 TaxID=694435 RepID=A0A318S6B3_9DEIO|nr:hypothetical protein [Deinococcus yavapaiensis]PYE53753.1 hypothetical protein DES52_10711 [Deinococcus yavapaiensis KR-236]